MLFFFFNDTATTEIYTLSLHDALPISRRTLLRGVGAAAGLAFVGGQRRPAMTQSTPPAGFEGREMTFASWGGDRKSTRLNSSHANISYAVFCLKKKKKTTISLYISTST